MSIRHDRFDTRDHTSDIISRLGLVVGPQAAQDVHITMEFIDETATERQWVFTHLLSPRDNLVVNVREVTNVLYFTTEVLEHAHQHIERNVHARVTNMGIVIGRHTADVHRYWPAFIWHKRLTLSVECIVQEELLKVGTKLLSGEIALLGRALVYNRRRDLRSAVYDSAIR